MRARELSQRAVCANNLRAIGASAMAYADQHDGRWMCPPFAEHTIDQEGIDYLNDTTQMGTPQSGYTPGEVGYERACESTMSIRGVGGSKALSTTRALWLLVRSGQNTLENFVCPGGADIPDSTDEIQAYYDFSTYANVSYGYQVPFGPLSTRPRTEAHPRQVFIADKGPFYFKKREWQFLDSNGAPVQLDSPPREWRPYNSPNHGGPLNGEGQNTFFADGSVEFHRDPAAGVDHDNIYTLVPRSYENPLNLFHGESPHTWPPPPYPGVDALLVGRGGHSTTDSLLYP